MLLDSHNTQYILLCETDLDVYHNLVVINIILFFYSSII